MKNQNSSFFKGVSDLAEFYFVDGVHKLAFLYKASSDDGKGISSPLHQARLNKCPVDWKSFCAVEYWTTPMILEIRSFSFCPWHLKNDDLYRKAKGSAKNW